MHMLDVDWFIFFKDAIYYGMMRNTKVWLEQWSKYELCWVKCVVWFVQRFWTGKSDLTKISPKIHCWNLMAHFDKFSGVWWLKLFLRIFKAENLKLRFSGTFPRSLAPICLAVPETINSTIITMSLLQIAGEIRFEEQRGIFGIGREKIANIV